MFNGPIPGESLTREPGNAPWEQPPQHAGVDAALNMYMEKLEDDDELLEDILFILDQGMPLDLFVDTLLLNGEMEGRHTPDVSFLIAPVLHEHLLSLAEAANVSVVEFQGETLDERKKKKTIQDLKIMLGKAGSEVAEETAETIDQAVAQQEQPMETPPVKEVPPKGLMSRRT